MACIAYCCVVSCTVYDGRGLLYDVGRVLSGFGCISVLFVTLHVELVVSCALYSYHFDCA